VKDSILLNGGDGTNAARFPSAGGASVSIDDALDLLEAEADARSPKTGGDPGMVPMNSDPYEYRLQKTSTGTPGNTKTDWHPSVPWN
jgi:hypothetical protein